MAAANHTVQNCPVQSLGSKAAVSTRATAVKEVCRAGAGVDFGTVTELINLLYTPIGIPLRRNASPFPFTSSVCFLKRQSS